MNKSGIYAIHCKSNDKYYIGKSINMNHRKYQHFQSLKSNCHNNAKLQNDYNKYGIDQFSFLELTTCPEDMLNHMEHYWISKYDSVNNGYNMINASTNLNQYDSTTDDLDFIELKNEYTKFFVRNIDGKIINNFDKKISIHKLKTLFDVLLNDSIDIKFIVECLCYNNINVYCMVTPTHPMFDIDCGLLEYEIEINEEIALDIIDNYDIDIFIKCGFSFSREERQKIEEYNKHINIEIQKLESDSIKIKNEIMQMAINLLQFYESKSFNDICKIVKDKNDLYDKLNNVNNKLNELEKSII